MRRPAKSGGLLTIAPVKAANLLVRQGVVSRLARYGPRNNSNCRPPVYAQGLPLIAAAVQARLHVVAVDATSRGADKAEVATAADGDRRHGSWGPALIGRRPEHVVTWKQQAIFRS